MFLMYKIESLRLFWCLKRKQVNSFNIKDMSKVMSTSYIATENLGIHRLSWT